MKKGLKKILAALAAGAMLLSMNMSAFALEYNASTAYKDANTATVTVQYTAGAEEQVAFLAEDADGIIYIDQKAGTGNQETFTFDVSLTDAIDGATLKAGSTSEAYAEAKKQTISVAGKTITVTSDENGYAAVEEATVYDGVAKLYVFPAPGYEVDVIKLDGTVLTGLAKQADGFYSIDLASTGKDVAIDVTFKTATVTGDAVAVFTKVDDNSTATDRVITVFGRVTSAKDGGILLSTAAITATTDIPENYSADATVRAFPALAVNDAGAFSVTLTEAASEDAVHLKAGTYYVGVYAANDISSAVVGSAEAVTLN